MASNLKYPTTSKIDFSLPINKSVLNGRSALITGGASGIGEALVIELATTGCYVTIADLDAERGKSLCDKLKADGLCVVFAQTDVTSFQSQSDAFKAAVAHSPNKQLDIVIPCAGIMGASILESIPSPDSPPQEPQQPPNKVLDINLMGVYYTMSLALHYFSQADRNIPKMQLIFISSLLSYIPAPLQSAYIASKAGVRALFKSLRDGAYALPYLRTNLIAPTLTRTPMTEPFCDFLANKGFSVSKIEDVVQAVMRILCDERIEGRAVGTWPGGAVDLCDDFEGFDGGQMALEMVHKGMLGEGPQKLGMFKFD